jgi:hypothetical protein
VHDLAQDATRSTLWSIVRQHHQYMPFADALYWQRGVRADVRGREYAVTVSASGLVVRRATTRRARRCAAGALAALVESGVPDEVPVRPLPVILFSSPSRSPTSIRRPRWRSAPLPAGRWLKLRGKRVGADAVGELAIIVVFGGATLLLQDETFIKWKPTVLYWLFGAVLAGAIALRRNLVRTMLSDQVQLPDAYGRASTGAGSFFAFMARSTCTWRTTTRPTTG